MCRQEVLVDVEPDDELSEKGRGVVERYREMVVGEHEDSCLWKQRGCDGINSLPFYPSDSADGD